MSRVESAHMEQSNLLIGDQIPHTRPSSVVLHGGDHPCWLVQSEVDLALSDRESCDRRPGSAPAVGPPEFPERSRERRRR